MKIAIDIDEVLAEQLDFLIEFCKKEKNIFVPKEDFFTYYWPDVWGISLEEVRKIDREFKKSEYFDKLEVVSGSVEVIEVLNKTNELFIITARPVEFKEKTKKWLDEKFGDNFNKVYHSSDFHIESNKTKKKSDFCKELGVGIIIEDNLEYSLDCAENGIKVILLDKPWNQGDLHENIFRCKSWSEILVKIKETENE